MLGVHIHKVLSITALMRNLGLLILADQCHDQWPCLFRKLLNNIIGVRAKQFLTVTTGVKGRNLRNFQFHQLMAFVKLLCPDVGTGSCNLMISRYMAWRVCHPSSQFRVGPSVVMWLASATPLWKQSISCWIMETSFTENEHRHWVRWWPTGEELWWCSETHFWRLLSVSPTQAVSQSEHWVWYTTPALSSSSSLSLGCTRQFWMVL